VLGQDGADRSTTRHPATSLLSRTSAASGEAKYWSDPMTRLSILQLSAIGVRTADVAVIRHSGDRRPSGGMADTEMAEIKGHEPKMVSL